MRQQMFPRKFPNYPKFPFVQVPLYYSRRRGGEEVSLGESINPRNRVGLSPFLSFLHPLLWDIWLHFARGGGGKRGRERERRGKTSPSFSQSKQNVPTNRRQRGRNNGSGKPSLKGEEESGRKKNFFKARRGDSTHEKSGLSLPPLPDWCIAPTHVGDLNDTSIRYRLGVFVIQWNCCFSLNYVWSLSQHFTLLWEDRIYYTWMLPRWYLDNIGRGTSFSSSTCPHF